jgi:hypothetical protein
MITLQELLNMSETDVDKMFEILDFKNLDEPFDPKQQEFVVDEYKYRCEFALGPSEKNPEEKILEFKFIAIDGPNKPKRADYHNDVQYSVATRKWGIGILGVGHPLKALKQALQSLLRYIRSYKPKYVSFYAEEPNRQRLYKKFYERYGYHIPEYKMCNKNPETNEPLDVKEFWLERTG